MSVVDDVEFQANRALKTAQEEAKDDAEVVSTTKTKPNLASISDVFSFARTARTRWYMVASVCFAIVSGSLFPGKQNVAKHAHGNGCWAYNTKHAKCVVRSRAATRYGLL